jgi:CheY-like chemotaxis protein
VTVSPPAILVVDDPPSNLHIACVFCAAGYDVTAVAGAAEAMRALQGHGPYALYILDIEIPGDRAAAVAARIRQSQPDARILYFTTFSEALFTLHGRLMPGREELLEKPVSNRKLLNAALRLLFGHDMEPDA